MIGTSPPIQKAPTAVTLRASSVAAPASGALPPWSRILTPASVAACLPETTSPFAPEATLPLLLPVDTGGGVTAEIAASCAAACLWANGTRISTDRSEIESVFFILPYQESRKPSCVTLALLPEFRVLRMPVSATAVGLFGWLNTLKKSILNRKVTRSLIFQNLNADASWDHCQGPFMYWFRQGCRLLL